ncbi:MAG: radical SAM protein [Staphylococcus epidermidis]|nr:radical SAM protein [Staphylococcus epidermidis]
MLKGHLHSVESMGTVDGPGLRYILFTQGCLLRCLYCHNPDTWKINEPSREVTVDEMVNEILKANGVHTCIDTSAGCVNDTPAFNRHFDELQKHTDLILLDIKHIDNDKHIKLTGKPNTHILKFARKLSDMKQPVWIRHVLVPGISDDKEDLIKLGEFINSLDNVEKFEILPYHQLGVHKWKNLGIPYQLENVEPPDDEAVKEAYRYVNFNGKIPVTL